MPSATRLTFEAIRPSQDTFQDFCPSCRRVLLRQGRHGARNRGYACNQACMYRFDSYRRGQRLGQISADLIYKVFPFYPNENA